LIKILSVHFIDALATDWTGNSVVFFQTFLVDSVVTFQNDCSRDR